MDAEDKSRGLVQPDTDEDTEKNKEIAAAAMALLLSALIVSVGPPLVLFVAYIFHLNIIR